MLIIRANFRRVVHVLTAVALFGVALALLGNAPASAHVSANADAAEPGAQTTVSFRVPNESESASTVRIKVAFPPDHPLPRVAPQVVAGWTVKINSERLDEPIENHGAPVTEAVTSIVWSGGKIPPGQFQEFPVRVGPLPEGVDELVFKSVQTYSDGEVVRWIDEQEPGGPEPAHPAPTLMIEDSAAREAEHADAQVAENDDPLARALGAGGLAGALVALGLAMASRRRPVH